MHTCTVDIETTALEAIGAGVLLCAVVKPYGRRERVFRGDDYDCRWGQEQPLLEGVLAELAKYDLWVGHNLLKFDWPWLRSRASFFGMPEPARPFIYDTLPAFRRLGYRTRLNGFGKPTASLGHVIDFFGYEQEKTSLYPRAQWDILWNGNEQVRRGAMDTLVSHCRADVSMTEQIYRKMLPVDYNATIKRAR